MFCSLFLTVPEFSCSADGCFRPAGIISVDCSGEDSTDSVFSAGMGVFGLLASVRQVENSLMLA